LLHSAGLKFAHPHSGARVTLRSLPDWLDG
jgi:hypothetical protein